MPRLKNKEQAIREVSLTTIGESLRRIRKARGFTQKGLGVKIGLTREAVASYETGRARLTDTVIIDLCAALRVSADELLGIRRGDGAALSRRWAKRINVVEGLPESIKKHILRTLDDVIKANTRLSIFDTDV